ncbi:MAG: hypothetical protein ACOCQN_01375, partial [Halanaerobiaceae bacterium]
MFLTEKLSANNKRILINRLLYNITLGLGLAMIIIGIFLLLDQQPVTQPEITRIDGSGLSLEYSSLSPQKDNTKITVDIPSGSSGLMVAEILEEKGLMTAAQFRKYMIMFDIEKKIKSGTYSFNEG